ncbi:unnamed protein product [Prunus brigantina]
MWRYLIGQKRVSCASACSVSLRNFLFSVTLTSSLARDSLFNSVSSSYLLFSFYFSSLFDLRAVAAPLSPDLTSDLQSTSEISATASVSLLHRSHYLSSARHAQHIALLRQPPQPHSVSIDGQTKPHSVHCQSQPQPVQAANISIEASHC